MRAKPDPENSRFQMFLGIEYYQDARGYIFAPQKGGMTKEAKPVGRLTNPFGSQKPEQHKCSMGCNFHPIWHFVDPL